MNDFAPLASWNGEIQPLDTLRIPATDRGFFFGDGVYEVVRLYRGRPFLLQEHMNRLRNSVGAIRIQFDFEVFGQSLRELLSKAPSEDAILYIQITRGSAPRNHLFPPNTSPNTLMFISALADPQAPYRAIGITTVFRDDIRWHRPDIKSLNLLPNVLLRQEAADSGAQEAILERWDGRITEATSSNVFIIRNRTVITPQSDHWILDGISRQFIERLCRSNGLPFVEEKLTRKDVLNAQEVFLSSTTCEVIGVARVDNHVIGSGTPGPITRKLYQWFQDEIKNVVSGHN